MSIAMTWEEWAACDAVALAALLRAGEVSPKEVAAQAAAAIARTNPALEAVIEVFADAVADPAAIGTDLAGPFAGVPYLMKDLGPTLAELSSLSSVYLSGGAQATWQLEEAVHALAKLPSLDKVEIRFNK